MLLWILTGSIFFTMISFDHLRPLLHGHIIWMNLVEAYSPYNLRKDNMTPAECAASVADNDPTECAA